MAISLRYWYGQWKRSYRMVTRVRMVRDMYQSISRDGTLSSALSVSLKERARIPVTFPLLSARHPSRYPKMCKRQQFSLALARRRLPGEILGDESALACQWDTSGYSLAPQKKKKKKEVLLLFERCSRRSPGQKIQRNKSDFHRFLAELKFVSRVPIKRNTLFQLICESLLWPDGCLKSFCALSIVSQRFALSRIY